MNFELKDVVVLASRLTQEEIDFHTARHAEKGKKRKWPDRLKKKEANKYLRDVSRVDFTLFDNYRRQRQHFLKKKGKRQKTNSSNNENSCRKRIIKSLSQKEKCNNTSENMWVNRSSPSNGKLLPLHLKRDFSVSTVNNGLKMTAYQKMHGQQSFNHSNYSKKMSKNKRPVIYDSDSDCSIENYGIVYSERDSSNFIHNEDKYCSNSNKYGTHWDFPFDSGNHEIRKTPSPIINEHDILSALTYEQQDDLNKSIRDRFTKLSSRPLQLNSKDFEMLVEKQTCESSIQNNSVNTPIPRKNVISANKNISSKFDTNSGVLQGQSNIFSVPSFVTAENENFISEVKNKYHSTDIVEEFDVVSKIMSEMDAQFCSNHQKSDSSDPRCNSLTQNNGTPLIPNTLHTAILSHSGSSDLLKKGNSLDCGEIVPDSKTNNNISINDSPVGSSVSEILSQVELHIGNKLSKNGAQFSSNLHKRDSSDTKHNGSTPGRGMPTISNVHSNSPMSINTNSFISSDSMVPGNASDDTENNSGIRLSDITEHIAPHDGVSADACSVDNAVSDILAKIVEDVSSTSLTVSHANAVSTSSEHMPSRLLPVPWKSSLTSSNFLPPSSSKPKRKCIKCESPLNHGLKTTCIKCQNMQTKRSAPLKKKISRDLSVKSTLKKQHSPLKKKLHSKGFPIKNVTKSSSLKKKKKLSSKEPPFQRYLYEKINKLRASKGKSKVWNNLSKYEQNRLSFVKTHCNQVKRGSAIPVANNLVKKAVALSPVKGKVVKPTVVHLKRPSKFLPSTRALKDVCVTENSIEMLQEEHENLSCSMQCDDEQPSIISNFNVSPVNQKHQESSKLCCKARNMKRNVKKKKQQLQNKNASTLDAQEVDRKIPSECNTSKNISKFNVELSKASYVSKKENIEVKNINRGLFLMTVPERDQEIELSSSKEIQQCDSEPPRSKNAICERKSELENNTQDDSNRVLESSDANVSSPKTNGHEISCAYLIPQLSSIVVAKYSSLNSVSGDYHLSGVFVQNDGTQTQSDKCSTQQNPSSVKLNLSTEKNMSEQSKAVVMPSSVSTTEESILAMQQSLLTAKVGVTTVQPSTLTMQENIPIMGQDLPFSNVIECNKTSTKKEISAEANSNGEILSDTKLCDDEVDVNQSVNICDASLHQVESKYRNLVLHELDAIAILSILDLDNSKSRSEELLKNLLQKEYAKLSSMKNLKISECDRDLKNIVAANVNQVMGKIRSLHFASSLFKNYGTLTEIVDAVLQAPPEFPVLTIQNENNLGFLNSRDTGDVNSVSSESDKMAMDKNPKTEGRLDCRFASNKPCGNEMFIKATGNSDALLIPPTGFADSQNSVVHSANNSTAFGTRTNGKIKDEMMGAACCMQNESKTQFNIIEKMQQQISTIGSRSSCSLPFPPGSPSYSQNFPNAGNNVTNSSHSPSFQQAQSPAHLNPSPHQETCSPSQCTTPNQQIRSPIVPQTASPALMQSPKMPLREEVNTISSASPGCISVSSGISMPFKPEKQTVSDFVQYAMQNPGAVATTAATTTASVSNLPLFPNANFRGSQFRQPNVTIRQNLQYLNQFLRPVVSTGPPPNQTVPFESRHILPFTMSRPATYCHVQPASNASKNSLRLPNGELMRRGIRVNQVVIPNSNLRQFTPYQQNQLNRVIQNNIVPSNYSVRLQSAISLNHPSNPMIFHGNGTPVSSRNSVSNQGSVTYSNTSNFSTVSQVPQAAWNKDAASQEMSAILCCMLKARKT